MRQKKLPNRVKGFTLMELIIVIAIIGILLGILFPSMAAYMRRSRIQAANMNAKMVYNAAQTAVQKTISSDRTATTASGFAGVVKISYDRSGVVDCVLGNNTFPSQDGTRGNVTACQNVVDAVNRTVSDAAEINWAVRVENYIVKAAVAANTAGTDNVGFFSANRQTATMETPRAPYSSSFDGTLDTLASGYGIS